MVKLILMGQGCPVYILRNLMYNGLSQTGDSYGIHYDRYCR